MKYPAAPMTACESGRSPCGERGLKFTRCEISILLISRRSPCGERGLKSVDVIMEPARIRVAPRAGSVG